VVDSFSPSSIMGISTLDALREMNKLGYAQNAESFE